MISEHGFSNPLFISSHSGEGIEALQSVVLDTLFGPKRTLFIHNPEANQMASEAILSRIFDAVYVHEHEKSEKELRFASVHPMKPLPFSIRIMVNALNSSRATGWETHERRGGFGLGRHRRSA